MHPLTWRTLVRLALTLPLASAPVLTNGMVASAQDTTAAVRDGWLVGPLVGLPGSGSDYDLQFMTLGVSATRLAPSRAGMAVAVGTIPRAIVEGVVPVAVRIGPSIPIALSPDFFLIPSVGLSGVGGIATGGAIGGTGGYYWGAAAVTGRRSTGFHLGVTWHRPASGEDVTLWLVELGIMRMPSPRPHR